MSRFTKMSMLTVSSLLVMIQFQNCGRVQMSSVDPAQSKLGLASPEEGSNGQPIIPVDDQPIQMVDCPELLVNGRVEYIPVQTIEEMVASQPAGSRTDYLNGLLNSCKSGKGSDTVSAGNSEGSTDSIAAKCVKVCHPEIDSTQNNTDDNSSDDNSSDDSSSDDNSSDDNSSDDNSSDDNSSDDNSSDD